MHEDAHTSWCVLLFTDRVVKMKRLLLSIFSLSDSPPKNIQYQISQIPSDNVYYHPSYERNSNYNVHYQLGEKIPHPDTARMAIYLLLEVRMSPMNKLTLN